MKAWLFQDSRQRKKLGDDKAPWSVGWYDPEGKKRSKRIGAHSAAEKFRRRIEGQLAAGNYQSNARKSWKDFRTEWNEKIGDGMLFQSRRETVRAIDFFERIIGPKYVSTIRSQTIDQYIAARRVEKNQRDDQPVRSATVNKELRSLKAVLRIAVDWGYLIKPPKFRMLRELKKLVRYVTPEDFAKVYGACGSAKRPENPSYSTGDWWRALILFAYMTGWRISEILALKWDDVSLDKATAVTMAEDNKGKRDDLIRLHPLVVEHLRTIVDFGPLVFSWPHHERTLWLEFHEIQAQAGVAAGYGFHDLRRAFATCNADRLTGDALQALMRHKSYSTTQRYINMTRQIDKAVDDLYVPEFLRPGPEGGGGE